MSLDLESYGKYFQECVCVGKVSRDNRLEPLHHDQI